MSILALSMIGYHDYPDLQQSSFLSRQDSLCHRWSTSNATKSEPNGSVGVLKEQWQRTKGRFHLVLTQVWLLLLLLLLLVGQGAVAGGNERRIASLIL